MTRTVTSPGFTSAVKQGGGVSYSVEHDETHRISEIEEDLAGGYENVNTFTYDADGNVTRIDCDADISDSSSTTTFTYDADGNLSTRRPMRVTVRARARIFIRTATW